MRVVFTAVPGHGHVNPMVPLARSLRARGHEITFVTGTEMRDRVEALGFRCLAAGPTLDGMQHDALADPAVRAWLASEPWRVAAAIFAGRVEKVLADLAAADLAPDLVVHDAYEVAGPLLAAGAGVPWVTHGLGPRWPAFLEDAVGEIVAPSWQRAGVEPIERGGLGHHAYLEICPPDVRPDDAAADPVLELQPRALDEPWHGGDPFGEADGPRVYATLGTFTNDDTRAFRSILDAAAGVDATVLLTVGDRVDLHALGPVPANVFVERYVPQVHVVRRCDLVVCHGGSGTVLEALAAGVPVVIVPQGADQFRNAPFWDASGAVVSTSIDELDASMLRCALADAVGDGPMRHAAHRQRDVITAMPPPEQVAGRLEALVDRVR